MAGQGFQILIPEVQENLDRLLSQMNSSSLSQEVV
jgi:hypothetical protein